MRERAGRVLRRPGRRRRGRPRHARGGHDRRRRSTASASAASRPKVDLVNLRAGQDSGYFFLGPTVDALTYAGDHGIDVVNMSYYVDPWLYNCAANPADSPAEQLSSSTIIAATSARSTTRAHGRDAGRRRGQRAHRPRQPDADDTSPDYPADGAAPPRRRQQAA